MRALLLAAGRGERLRPLTDTTPKCLTEIGGRPLLDWWLDMLLGSGCVERVLINSHWLAGQVWSHLAMSRWRDQVDLVHEPTLLGTAGTIRENLARLGVGPSVVAHADGAVNLDLPALLDAHRHRRSGCCLTMAVFRTDNPTQCGIVETDENGVVIGFDEKPTQPRGNLASAAIYVIEPDVLAQLMGEATLDFASEVIPSLVGRMQIYHLGYYRDIGTPMGLAMARLDYNDLRWRKHSSPPH